VVVKKTLRYSNVFFYNHLYPNSLIRNIIMESGINILRSYNKFNIDEFQKSRIHQVFGVSCLVFGMK
jgi:hypothetical protein